MSGNTLNKKIKKRRIELGYTLDELAQITGYAKTTLHRYENDNDLDLGTNKIQHLANCLKVTPAYLMGWESQEVSSEEIYKISKLLSNINVDVDYDEEEDIYYLTSENENYNIYLEPKEFKMLNLEVISFLKFKLTELRKTHAIHVTHLNDDK